ncbi:hypothetical protein ILUMI_20652 [Ignelater luminosus]|uniref:Uncharacterized protein n=1 Tax=Ignelater luminosus TaxID=2038154 RepID=A0A8K0CKA1_IGNLU|nr:hypothetical protein ILUMI_20652 [Ignelater luminosus]
MQPLDVSVFRPIEQSWRAVCKQWRIDNDRQEVSWSTFCKAFYNAMHRQDLQKAIISRFKATGLFHFTPDSINYNKIFLGHQANPKKNRVALSLLAPNQMTHLQYLKSKINPLVLLRFKSASGEGWQGNQNEKVLYEVWRDNNLQNEEMLPTHPDLHSSENEQNAPQSTISEQERPSLVENKDNAPTTFLTGPERPPKVANEENTPVICGTPKKKKRLQKVKEPSVITGEIWQA